MENRAKRIMFYEENRKQRYFCAHFNTKCAHAKRVMY